MIEMIRITIVAKMKHLFDNDSFIVEKVCVVNDDVVKNSVIKTLYTNFTNDSIIRDNIERGYYISKLNTYMTKIVAEEGVDA